MGIGGQQTVAHAIERMPLDAYQYFYQCVGCGVLLKPKAGNCYRVLLVRLRDMSAQQTGGVECGCLP